MIKIFDTKEIQIDKILSRKENAADVQGPVSEIISQVKAEKDAALFSLTEKFDKVKLNSLEVTKEEIEAALNQVEPEFIEVLKEAKCNIEYFHRNQKRSGFCITHGSGALLGQKIVPLERVGVYVPGGTASYPSTVLMDCIPTKIAGVGQIIMVTPPDSGGSVKPQILAAASIAGVDKIFKVGGAQAIAALAYGTESIEKVDKIVGPGNVFVAEAKRQVYGRVDIDMIAGPSEILIIADSSCRPDFVAADLLSQAEHDKLASAVLVTTSRELANAVCNELEHQLKLLPREQIARASIENNGKIIIVPSIDEAINISNIIAPEHLEVCCDNAFDYLDKIKNAGSIFLGKYCPEALGDYFAGPNHTLPTSGTARFSSPLSVDDFVKKSSYIHYTQSALEKVSAQIEMFAEKEGLDAHARSVSIRRQVSE